MDWPDIALKTGIVITVMSIAGFTVPKLIRALFYRTHIEPATAAEVEADNDDTDYSESRPWEITGETEEVWRARWKAEDARNRYARRMRSDLPVDEAKWKGDSDNSRAYRELVINGLLNTEALGMSTSTHYCAVCYNTGLEGGLDGICQLNGSDKANECNACTVYNENVKYAYRSTRYARKMYADDETEEDNAWAELDPETRKLRVINALSPYYPQPIGISCGSTIRINVQEVMRRVILALAADPSKWLVGADLHWHEWYDRKYRTYKHTLSVSSVLLYQHLNLLVLIGFVEVRELEDRELVDTPAQTAYRITKHGQEAAKRMK